MMKQWSVNLSLLAVAFFLSGFNYSNNLVPLPEILSGGPPKDGIPALTDPAHLPTHKAGYLKQDDRVIGVALNGEARAYPIQILNWHEIVNDRLGRKDIVATYCPLCGTGMVFSGIVDGTRLEFGVSGKLYNSDVLLYDRKTESLWSQIKMEAVTGKMSGKPLTLIPSRVTTWQDWKTRHPRTTALSMNTGYSRDYSRDPYKGYEVSKKLYFPVYPKDNRLHPKEWVIGLSINGESKAYPFSRLADGRVEDMVGGQAISVMYDKANRSAVILDKAGEELPAVTGYWFAWAAFYPNTIIFPQ